MKLLKWSAVIVGFIIFILSFGLYIKTSERNFTSAEKALFTETYPLPEIESQIKSTLSATYFGTSTILFNDGEHSILIDGLYMHCE